MALPYRSESEVEIPKEVRAHGNGRLPRELLEPCGIGNLTLVGPAARACRALVAAAAADGIRLGASSTYRSYDEQLEMFTGRYSPDPLPDAEKRRWDGRDYWLRPGQISVAPPGTSFHGWGLAVDFQGPAARGPELDATTLAWFAEHGPAFGFWNSVPKENWHWPYFLGHDLPEAVLRFEQTAGTTQRPRPPAAPVAAPPAKAGTGPQRGATAAATAAFHAGFRGADLVDITMIAGRESGWQSDRINPRTSDRGMWQINWKNLQRDSYAELRRRLGIDGEMDLLDLTTNAAVAFSMYQDSVKAGEPWFPWRASDTGHKNAGPGWDPKGSHRWRTERFAAEAAAAARAVEQGGGSVAPGRTGTTPPTAPSSTSTSTKQRGTYVIVASDSDGISAVVGRCLGLADAPFAVRRAAAAAVAAHTGLPLETAWKPGDVLRFPPTIDGVRCYTVRAGDGLLAIARGLGLGQSAAAQQRVTAINAWQGTTPHPGDTWYGGASA